MKHLLKIALLLTLSIGSVLGQTTLTGPEGLSRTKNATIKPTASGITPQMLQDALTAATNLAAQKSPYVTLTEFRMGKSDSARVAFIRTVGSIYYPFAYVGDTTTINDGDKLIDNGVNILTIGKKIYRMLQNTVTPEMFGAVGNGIANDSLAFRKMQDFLNNTQGSGSAILGGKTYYKAYFDIKKPHVNLIGNGTVFKDGYVRIGNNTAGEAFDFLVHGIAFERTNHVTIVDNATTNNAVVLRNVGMGSISNCSMRNYNAGIYVEPTDIFQAVRRIEITDVRTYYGNFGIKVPHAANRTCGDFTITNCVFNWSKYDNINIDGMDGLNISDITCFMSGDNTNRGTKRNNFRFVFMTYVAMNNIKAFEAGESSMYMERTENVSVTNYYATWSGQRLSTPAIYINNIQDVDDPELPFTFSNIQIDTPTGSGILIDGPYDTQMYVFTNISVNKIGRADRYYGDGAPYNNPGLGTYEKHSIWVKSPAVGIYYQGVTDTEYWGGSPTTNRAARIQASGAVIDERNTRRASWDIDASPDMAFTSHRDVEAPTYVQNYLTNSNSLAAGAYYAYAGIKPVVADSAYNGFDIKDRVYWIRDSGAGNTQKAISLADYIDIDSTRAGVYTFSTYIKPGGRGAVCLYITDGTNWLKTDFDLYTTKIGQRLYNGSTHKLVDARIERAFNGYYRISISDSVSTGTKKLRPWIYLKDLMYNPGNPSYTGDDSSGVWMHDWSFTKSRIRLPYVRTTGTALARTDISYGANAGLKTVVGSNNINAVTDVNGNVYVTGVGVLNTFVENRLQYSNQLSTSAGWSTSGSTDLGIIAVADTISPVGNKGKIFRLWDKTTTNVARAIWNNATVANTNNTVAQKWTGSIDAKAGEIPAINLNFTNTGSSGSISYDIDLVNHKLMRKNAGTSGTYGLYAGNDSILVQKLPNGWWRYTATVTVPATAPNVRMRIYTKGNNTTHVGNAAYAGTVGNRVYLANANLAQADGYTEYAENIGATTTGRTPVYSNPVYNVAGTANQVNVTTKDSTGTVTFSLPQSIGTNADFQVSRFISYITNGSVGGFDIMAASGSNRFMRFGSGASVGAFSSRFRFGLNSTAESGSNVGSDFEAWRYADDGTTVTLVYRINRATGSIFFNAGFSANLATYANNADAITGGLATNTFYKTATGEVRIVVP